MSAAIRKLWWLYRVHLARSSKRRQLVDKILSNVVIDENGCWVWQGATSGSSENTRGHGYGRVSAHGYTAAVHRVMWVQVNGYLPAKKQIDHQCKNRLCCNPEHLRMVTHKQNQRARRLK